MCLGTKTWRILTPELLEGGGVSGKERSSPTGPCNSSQPQQPVREKLTIKQNLQRTRTGFFSPHFSFSRAHLYPHNKVIRHRASQGDEMLELNE